MDPFLGEIRIFTWDWAPSGWALCNGASLPAQQNAALNALLGQTYGGNGSSMFNLPDLRGRTPIGTGYGQDGFTYQIGAKGGAETVALALNAMPQHSHSVNAVAATKGNAGNISGNFPATVGYATGKTAGSSIYAAPQNLLAIASDTLGIVGGSQAHPNMQPFAVVNFCIATQGIFPPRQ